MPRLEIHVHNYQDHPVPPAHLNEITALGGIFPSNYQISVHRGKVIGRNGTNLTTAQLNNDLGNLNVNSGSGNTWKAHVLVGGNQGSVAKAYGQMFDLNPPRYREGCAVFMNPMDTYINGDASLLPLIFARTVLHEVGHMLNLDHSDAWKVIHLMRSAPPHAHNRLRHTRLAEKSHKHLVHHDPETQRPGSGVKYLDRRACPPNSHNLNTDGSTFSQGRVRLSLRINPGRIYSDVTRPTFVRGEPVWTTLEITNHGSKPVKYQRGMAGRSPALITLHRESQPILLDHPERLCGPMGKSSRVVLAPGATHQFDEVLYYRAHDVVTNMEGICSLQASMKVSGTLCHSNPVEIAIVPPLFPEHERHLTTALQPDLGLFLELDSDLAFSRGVDALNHLMEVAPKFPTLDWALGVLKRRHHREDLVSHFDEKFLYDAGNNLPAYFENNPQQGV
jgi:hypothetical protein